VPAQTSNAVGAPAGPLADGQHGRAGDDWWPLSRGAESKIWLSKAVVRMYSSLSLAFSVNGRRFSASSSAGTVAPPHMKQNFFSMALRSDIFSVISATFSFSTALLLCTRAFAYRNLKRNCNCRFFGSLHHKPYI
jgi:hypothetical protein